MTRAPKRIDDDNLNESNNGVDWYEKFENDDYFSIIWGPRLQTVADTAYIIKDYFFAIPRSSLREKIRDCAKPYYCLL